jgi:oligosaccharide repeat unit polymerase
MDDHLISNINLIFYIFLWGSVVFIYQFKKRQFDAGSLILATYFIYSIFSFFLFNNPLFFFNRITFFPFVYLFITLIIVFFPILKFDASKVITIQKPSKLFFNLVCWVFVIFSFVQLPTLISNFSNSIIQLIVVSTAGQDLYNDAMAESYLLGDGSIANFPSIITNAYGNFGILLFFYYLTLENKKNYMIFFLFISCIIGLMSNISLGQRGPIVEIIFSFIVTYFYLKKFIEFRIRKLISIIGIVFLVVVSLPVIALTTSRFGDTLGGSSTSVLFYAGQQNIVFNNYGLDNGGIRYGDRVFPFFKRVLGFDNVPNNFWERRDKYPELFINDEAFIGFVGDFTLDFGPFVTPFIFIFFSLFVFMFTKIRNGVILFHQIILLHFLITVCMLGGLKLYPYSDLGGNLQLIFYFCAFTFFRIDYGFRQSRVINSQ